MILRSCLIGRDQHRVMVFQDSSIQRISAIAKKLAETAANCLLTQPGDRYWLRAFL
jgi:hypothetical protein